MSVNYKIRVGITLGDPSGVGAEITAKALNQVGGAADFSLIGDAQTFKNACVSLNNGDVTAYNFINLNNVNAKSFRYGQISAKFGKASIEYLNKALKMIKKKEIDCLVTAPVSKEAINLAHYRFSGQTEFLQAGSNVKHTVMMLLNERLKFSLLTRHIPLKKVSKAITKDVLLNNINITCQGLEKLFLIKRPRIVVCGLNPHASDNGIIGKEENSVIKPVLKSLEKKNIYISGPLSADVAIYLAYKKIYDCVLAVYHDQALIPLKLFKNESGVNLTLGLGFIRTSPLHGTAFDIAGTNRADPSSMVAAIKTAIECARNQNTS